MKKNRTIYVWGLMVVGVLLVLIFIFINFIKPSKTDVFNPNADFPFYLDCQPSLAVGENGYYYFDEQKSLLHYYDIKRKASYYVCTQPLCSHNSMACNAYFDPTIFGGLYSYIWSNNGRIYLLGRTTETGSLSLYSLNMDGGDRKKEFDLCLYPDNDYVGIAAAIHRGYIYYAISLINTDNTSVKLFRKSLDKSSSNSNSEELFEFSGDKAEILRIKGFGDKIYFQCYSPNPQDEENNGIYSFEIVNDYPQIVKQGAIREYTVVNSALYYCTNSNVYVRDLESGIEKTFYEAGMATSVSYDGNYFYVDNRPGLQLSGRGMENRKIVVLDNSGREIDEIELKNGIGPCLFGDEKYMFSFCSDTPTSLAGERWLEAFDKNQIGASCHSWSRLP